MRPSQSPGGGQVWPDDQHRSERALATARVLLSVALLPAVFVDSHGPGTTLLIQGATAGYLLFAGLVRVLLQGTVTHSRFFTGFVHAGDLASAAGMMVLTGAGFPFVLTGGFALLAAAWRWGLTETLATATCVAAFQLAQTLVVPLVAGTADGGAWGGAAADSVVRSACFLIAGVLLGYLAQTDKQTRLEASVVANVVSQIDLRLGLSQTIAIGFDVLLRVFNAERAVLVVHDTDSGRVSRWDGVRLTATPATEPTRASREDESAIDTYLSAPVGSGVHVIRRGPARDRLDAVWVDRHGTPVRSSPPPLPDALISAMGPFQQLMAVSVGMPAEWTAGIFLIDPRVSTDRSGAVAFAQRVVRRLVPVVYNVYLLRRMRARSVADERGRMARELHDGMVQTILGVQVQLHALAVQSTDVRRELAVDLSRLGMTLREEVLRLREMMQEMKQISPSPEQLVDTISAIVQRFETETGIRTRFVTRNDRVPLVPRACLEVTRIVQEALVNVRRHSGARNVFVRLMVDGNVCCLSVDDDGRGFPFTGRSSLSDLDKTQQGPWVIKDRVKRLGGEITVDSSPGQGARLEIKFPVSKYAAQG